MNRESTVHTPAPSSSAGHVRTIESVRADFPALSVRVHDYPIAYFDNAATSQKPQVVIDRIQRYYREENANVHRGVHALSQKATDAYEGARDRIARYINAGSRNEIVFTGGTTESINLVAHSWGGANLKPGDEILISGMEHHSNIVPWQLACERAGAELKVLPVTDMGELALDEYRAMLSDRTRLVALVHVSNSLGTINPVRRMTSEAHNLNIPVLVDGAQALPHGPVDVQNLDCDFYCFSSHKAFGPTGFGVLYGKQEYLEAMPPWQGGGDMIEEVDFAGTTFNDVPFKFEAGTPHIEGAIGFAVALDYLESVGLDWIAERESELLAYGTSRLGDVEGIRIIGTASQKASVLSFLVGSTHPYDVGTVLDRFGIAVRTGHHCTQPLMKRFGIPGTIRASLTFYNTKEEIDRMIEALHKASTMLQ